MDNIITNINLEDIILNKFQLPNKDSAKVQEMALAIKKFGIVDPILVRPKNGKYEIILGYDSYQAATLAGLKTIPALIKEVDDEVFNEYMMLNNIEQNKAKPNKFINISSNDSSSSQPEKKTPRKPINAPKNVTAKQDIQRNIVSSPPILNVNYTRNNSSDIVNLSELDKKEYERNDFNMNNNLMNNNLGQSQNVNATPVAEPTFGGRFFPSLEDEPTNMNMGGLGFVESPTQNIPTMNSPQQPINNMNNNLIDLTDIGIEKEPAISMTPPNNPQPVQDLMPNNVGSAIQVPMGSGFPEMNQPLPSLNSDIPNSLDNIVNLNSLQPNNDPPTPINNIESIPNINNLGGMGNQINPPMGNLPPIEQPQVSQFDMSPNVAPVEFLQNQAPAPTPISIPNSNMPQNNFGTPVQPPMGSGLPEINQAPMMGQDITMGPEISQSVSAPIPENISTPPKEIVTPPKDIKPVLNTLKTLATSLETFGYKINVIEEDSVNSAKITIEVEK